MRYYLDASAVVPIFVGEARSSAVADTLAALEELPCLSDYGAGEVASAISRHVRMETFSAEMARSILDDFDQWASHWAVTLQAEPADIQRASRIVRRFDLKLKFPDALHVAICENHGFVLVTGDTQMASAAAILNVEILSVV